jgi:hypothetical protein
MKKDGVGDGMEVNGSMHACDGRRSLRYTPTHPRVMHGACRSLEQEFRSPGFIRIMRTRRIQSHMSACVGRRDPSWKDSMILLFAEQFSSQRRRCCAHVTTIRVSSDLKRPGPFYVHLSNIYDDLPLGWCHYWLSSCLSGNAALTEKRNKVRNQCISVFSVVCVMMEFIHHSTGFHSDLSNLLVLAGKAERCGVVWWLLPFWSGGKGRDDSLSGNMMVSCAVSSLCGGIFGGVRLRHARGCSCRQSHDHGCPHRTPGSLCDFFFFFSGVEDQCAKSWARAGLPIAIDQG